MFAVYFRVRYLKKWNIILKDLKEFLPSIHVSGYHVRDYRRIS